MHLVLQDLHETLLTPFSRLETLLSRHLPSLHSVNHVTFRLPVFQIYCLLSTYSMICNYASCTLGVPATSWIWLGDIYFVQSIVRLKTL